MGSGRSLSEALRGLDSETLSIITWVSAAAICERSGGDYVGHTCEHHWTPTELAAQQWCETHGGVYLQGNGCEFGEGGP